MHSKNMDHSDYVKKQTLIGAVIGALLIGFIGGVVYSSYKLGGQAAVQANRPANMPAAAPTDEGPSIDMASQILKIEQYLKNHPKDEKAWAQLGHLFFDSDQYVNAIEAYQKSLEINPSQIGVITDMGVMYRRNKQPQKAVESFNKAISMDPKFETARFNKGIVLLHDLNDFEGGIKAWEELVQINPLATAPNGESVDSIIMRMKNTNQ